MYAIIATGGKQYTVSEGDVIKVEKLGVNAGDTVTFDQVLFVNNGEAKVGDPTVAGATVTASVVEEGKDKKVIVYKYKRKTGYHKKNGEETELDRTVIDEIGDPLQHLLRNAADHGLESNEERLALGKEEVGQIYLDAYQDGNNVNIVVRDDGAGIDVEKVKQKAIENLSNNLKLF